MRKHEIKKLCMCLMLSLLPISALADSTPESGEEDLDIVGKCPELNLTQAQKDQLQIIRNDAKTKCTALRAQLKDAKSALEALLSDSNATQPAVADKEAAIKGIASAMLDSRFETANHVVFNVFTKDQRAPGMACIMKLKEEWKKAELDKRCAARNP